MNTAHLRRKIKQVREKKEITLDEMAEKLHMDKRSYQRIESGEKKNIDVQTVFQIAEALEKDPFELLAQDALNIEHIEHNNIVGVTVFANADIAKQFEQIIAEKDKIIINLNSIISMKDKTIEDLKS